VTPSSRGRGVAVAAPLGWCLSTGAWYAHGGQPAHRPRAAAGRGWPRWA